MADFNDKSMVEIMMRMRERQQRLDKLKRETIQEFCQSLVRKHTDKDGQTIDSDGITYDVLKRAQKRKNNERT